MAVLPEFPDHYRNYEVERICRAVRAGECAAVLGLSGSGKSNLISFLAGQGSVLLPGVEFVRIDCNRLSRPEPDDFYSLAQRVVGGDGKSASPLDDLAEAISRRLAVIENGLCLLLDRFDSLIALGQSNLASNLRALRDEHKYRLTYVITSRQTLPVQNELAELFFGHTFWLGPLAEEDARWSARQYARRAGIEWSEDHISAILALSGRYPSFLRATCQAAADGSSLDPASLVEHPAVRGRLEEFWSDAPDEGALRASGLSGSPLLDAWVQVGVEPGPTAPIDLTAKEKRLLDYFMGHAGQICEKDDLIVAVWPEDQVYDRGLRDDSLAQLVRRLREKIEPDPSHPRQIQTVPGRGYRYFTPPSGK
jgi:hypothetical protein